MTDPAVSDAATLATLATWLSPGFPVGAYAYSHGLEEAIACVDVADADALRAWIDDVLRLGAGWSDAVLLCEAHAAACADDAPRAALASELAVALTPSSERRLETTALGDAFERATVEGWRVAPPAGAAAPSYPTAVGWAAGRLGAPREMATALYLQALAASLISVGVRLIPIGQIAGQQVMAALTPSIAALAEAAAQADLDALGGCAFRVDIASMRHETLETRLFRT